MNINTGQSPKQSEFAAIGKALAEIIEKNKKPATLKVKPHEAILDEFLNEIESIDFREILGLESQDKIQQKQLIVLTIDEILSLIRKNDFGLCSKDGFVYLFNGAFWKPIDREEFRSFLGKAAARLGVNELEAKHFAFRDNLYKQFNAVADAPKLKETEGVLVNLQNVTLEVSETEFLPREHRREDFLTYQLEFAFDDKAQRKLFDAYLERVLPDRELQYILAEFIAYCFTRHLKLEKCLFLYGTGANGKSVFFDVISALLGAENITSFSLDNLNEEHNRALINNKLLNYSSELGKKTIDSDLFKKLVSGEAVQCRLKYGNPFFSRRYAKLMFNCNELPRDVEVTNAFFRRFLIIPFCETIPQKEQDIELAAKIIKNELSGVFNWVIDGLNRLLKNKQFTESEVVSKMEKDFREQSDSVQLFLSENDYQKSPLNYVIWNELYAEYRQFCSNNGIPALKKLEARRRLNDQGYQFDVKNFGIAIYVSK